MGVTSPERALPSPLPLRVWVGGRARTKGSLRWQGTRAVEQVAGSKGWRETVAGTVLRVLGSTPGPGGPVVTWEPHGGPVAVSLTVWLPRPASRAAEPYPTRRTDGDLDKLARNVGDALTDAAVITDDTMVVHWSAWKLWAPSPERSGVLIEVVAVDAPVPTGPIGTVDAS